MNIIIKIQNNIFSPRFKCCLRTLTSNMEGVFYLKEKIGSYLSFGVILVRSNIGDIVGFTFSVLTGVFFGFYPAYKASKLIQ